MNWHAFWLLCAVALVYLVVVTLTYSWMIAAPRKWLVKSQMDRLRATLNVADRVDGNHEICAIVDNALTKVEDAIDTTKKKRLTRLFRAVNLNELMAAQQTV